MPYGDPIRATRLYRLLARLDWQRSYLHFYCVNGDQMYIIEEGMCDQELTCPHCGDRLVRSVDADEVSVVRDAGA